MGVNLELRKRGRLVRVPAFIAGSLNLAELGADGELHAVPTCEAEVAITYNYSVVYREVIPDYPGLVRFFDGKRAGDLIPTLDAAVAELGTERSDDYWEPSRGNAGWMLALILSWARLHPDAVFAASG